MASFDCTGMPRCTIDFPLEITPDEMAALSGPINTLLKSSYLLGSSLDTTATFNSLFDIAEEISRVEAGILLLCPEGLPDQWEPVVSRHIETMPSPEAMPYLVAPAVLSRHFDKAVSLDPAQNPVFLPICDAWQCRSLVSFPLRKDRDVTGALVFGKRDSHPFRPVQIKLLWVLAMQAENQLHRSDSQKTLSFYSFLDPLTHLYNRLFFDTQLEKEIIRSRRSGEPFSLLMLDIDDFKEYNDKFLHASGDIALQEFAGILGGCVREVDTVARLGGDEFAVILLESNAEGANTQAERIIQRFRRHLLPGREENRSERLSASIGIASFPSDAFDKTDLVAKAERALHAARSKGGARACMFHENAEAVLPKTAPAELPVRKIYDAGRSVVDMDKFLEILLFTGMQGLGANRGSIVVKDSAGEFSLRATIGFGRHEEYLAASPSISPGPITSWVLEHQIPLVVSRAEESPVGQPQRKNGYQSESFLSIPLNQAGRTLGVLNLTNRKDQQPFSREDLKAFAPVASGIAGILSQGMEFRENVRSFSLSILGSLTDTLELRFPFLSGHSSRVRDHAVRVGQHMGLAAGDLDTLRIAAELHDVGIVGVPGNLLAKKRRLTDRELEMARKHPFMGSKMLEGVPGIDAARRAILEHHENFDGSGYPYGLRGGDTSLAARILHIAEFCDSVVSDRPYRQGMNLSQVTEMINQGAGSLFDPEVVQAYNSIPH